MQPESVDRKINGKIPATQTRSDKTSTGNFFEDFRVGQGIAHATPRTVTVGDVALYNGLYGPRFAVQSSDAFAQAIGYPRAPVDDLLVFHIVFGKTVPDISINAVANLGYAACRFLAPVYCGDTLHAASEVIGLKENSGRKTGLVFVRSTGCKHDGTKVLEYVRWVMVRKRDEAAPAPAEHVPRVPEALLPSMLGDACPPIDVAAYDFALAGSPYRFGDYDDRREDRPHRRHHRRGSRAPDRDPALPEPRAHPFQSVRRGAGPLRPPPDLWRPRDLARPRAVVQRARQCISRRGDQRRAPCRAAVRRRHRVRVVGGAGQGGAAGAPRRRRAAAAHGRDQGPAVRGFPAQAGEDDDPAVILDLDYWVLMPR